jgi:hypothetical protein
MRRGLSKILRCLVLLREGDASTTHAAVRAPACAAPALVWLLVLSPDPQPPAPNLAGAHGFSPEVQAGCWWWCGDGRAAERGTWFSCGRAGGGAACLLSSSLSFCRGLAVVRCA